MPILAWSRVRYRIFWPLMSILKTAAMIRLDKLRGQGLIFPDDVMQVTGSGGKHFLYKYPGSIGRSTTNLWPGIDTRGDRGYIVVAPSNHISGQDYFWDSEADPLNGAIPPPCPEWLLAKLSEKPQPESKNPAKKVILPPGEVRKIGRHWVIFPPMIGPYG